MTSSASADDNGTPVARRAAKIERALETQAAQNLDVGVGDVAKMVGAEDLPPANNAATSGRIAPEVAEIAGTGKIEVAGERI
jgi:hypothetical protein